MNRRHILATPIPFLLASGTWAQAPAFNALTAPAATASLSPIALANLLPAGRTQGTFHLRGLVRKDRTIVLRWANDQGEMPTEGVRVFRQKVGDADWKDLTGRKPLGFLQGKAAEKRLNALPAEDRERILAYPFGDVQHDPATRLRITELPTAVRPKGLPDRARDLSPEKSLKQFRELRALGRLNRADLQLMHMRADMDAGMAEILGLTFTDDPGKGQFRYKIVIALPEGGSAEAITPTPLNTLEPTPIPQPLSLTAASGNGEVLLNWDEAPSEAVAGYNVYRAENPGGPWQRLNADPVKKVQLELEDPETTMRRSRTIEATMDRMLRPLPEAARTPQKVLEARKLAHEQALRPGGLQELSPATSKAIKEAVAAGRLRPGGIQAPQSLYTDSRHTPGNALVNERTYHYKVTAVDLGGLEQPMDTAPTVAGTPKDLEPPQVPGRPMLKTEMAARTELRGAQEARLKDPQLLALNQSLAARQVRPVGAAAVFQPQAALGAAPAPAASKASSPAPGQVPVLPTVPSSLSPAEAKRLQLSRTAATMPVAALRKLGEAAVLPSNPDGSVPPAQLAWAPSPDADLAGYEIHRATGTGSFAKVAATTTAEWTDTGLVAGQAYRYAICSVDKLGNASARSPEGRLEVSDRSLPGRLALTQVTGRVAQDAPASAPSRRFLRPAGRVMASGTFRAARAAIQPVKGAEPIRAAFQAPAATTAPKVKARVIGVSAVRTAPAKELATGPVAPAPALQALVKPSFRKVARSFNPMLAPIATPKEIHVLLEWARPVQGFPLEYVVTQAPQRMEPVSVTRPNLAALQGFRAFEARKASPGLGPLRPAAPAPTAASSTSVSPAAGPVLVATTPALHQQVARGLVASSASGGLHRAEARRDRVMKLVAAAGPGSFTRAHEAPVTTEKFVATFPADIAQYGGTTFYFRVQAFTKEFGRTVEGPMSDPIEVRLPDIVAPPSPAVGAVDLQEGAPGSLEVFLTWTQAPARDLAGVRVDRQPMTYTLVEGEARPGSPAGPPEQLTPAPMAGLSFRDKKAPSGFQRYTLRAVDATGNASEALGAMDILVPGEPDPGAPTQLALTGHRLTWKAAPEAAGYTVWRSFTGQDDDYVCISGILGASETGFNLPAEGTLHLRVVARSISGMNSTPSAPLVRTP